MTQVIEPIERNLEHIAAKIITDRARVNSRDAFEILRAAKLIEALRAESAHLKEVNRG